MTVIFGWLRRRKRRRLLESPLPESWVAWLEELRFFGTLSDSERSTLVDIARVLVAEKHWEGCGGLTVTDEMRLKIAAQAALLLIAIPHDHYREVSEILIYPSTYRNPRARRGDLGIVDTRGSANLGEAWYRGPVVLAWDACREAWANEKDGRNVVLHEFAHVLDFLDGTADGAPLLAGGEARARWRTTVETKYLELVGAAEDGRPTLLDKYGATSPAEFFAVSSECFFEKPRPFRNRHPDLYSLLRDYFQQDPAARDPRE